MAKLTGKGLVREIERNKFNISELHPATLEQDIDYIFHVECEVPMEWFTKLEEVKKKLVNTIIVHSDEALRRRVREITRTIAKNLQESVGDTVMDCIGNTTETVVVAENTNLESLMGEK